MENAPAPEHNPNPLIYRIALGVVVILIGALFLAHEHGYRIGFFGLDNWWALFILIPAIAMTVQVVLRVRRLGRFDAEAAGTSVGALATTLVAVLFLFELPFGKWWPLFIMLGGVAILISAVGKSRSEP